MPSLQHQTVQEQFTRTAEAFSVSARRDTAEVLAQRLEFAELAAGQRLLDVACGPGAFVLAAAPRVRFARGLDLTAEMLRQARRFQQEYGVTNASFDRGDAQHLPYASGAFDVVSCQFAFHHLPNPEAAFREMLRVARPAGRLFIVDSVGPEDSAKAEVYDHIERLRDPSHTTTFSLAALHGLFASNGVEIAKESVRDRARSFNQWMLRAGAEPREARYQATRRAVEESIPGDRAGFSPRASGDDLTIIHQEGMFLVARRGDRISH
jgi:ubiquinone/menaquinone biosynthesis C-methylase UbiE